MGNPLKIDGGIPNLAGNIKIQQWNPGENFINHRFGGYHLVMTNSSPWKDPPFLRTVNHLFLWAMASMAMLVITRW
jgi:hypothetical protein